ncbi:MAG TPA: cell envelope integrity protein TolA [Desulfobacterales bacterium]|nr:cell envelope integrity protein TolA [Desulfobacterales bacterium]
MNNGGLPDPSPSDRLGRMLLLSMAFHLVLFGVLWYFNAKSPKVKPLRPTYTVDLVNMPLPAPAPTIVKPESSPAGETVRPTREVREKPGPAIGLAPEPKKTQPDRMPPKVEKKPLTPLKPARPVEAEPAARAAAKPAQPAVKPIAPAKPVAKVETPPKTVAKPLAPPKPPIKTAEPVKEVPKPTLASKPKEIVPPTPPVARSKPTPKGRGEAKATTESAKPVAEPAKKSGSPNSASGAADAKARDREIAQEISRVQSKANRSSRDQAIQDSIRGLEKGLAAKSREQEYQEAVRQAAAKVSAGKVSAKVSGAGSGKGGSAGGGALGSAQAAAYGSKVSQMVKRHWQPNCLQRSTMHHLKAVIVIRIQSDGTITASWFEKESGDRLFDQSAMSAVTRSNPLPTLPPGREQLEIGITFTPEWKASS